MNELQALGALEVLLTLFVCWVLHRCTARIVGALYVITGCLTRLAKPLQYEPMTDQDCRDLRDELARAKVTEE